MVFWLLGERAHCKCAQKGGYLAEFSILWLQLGRKIVSLHQGRVFELDLPLRPLLPRLAGVNHGIAVHLPVFSQKISHVFHSDHLFQIFQEHGIVYIPIVVLFGQLFILFGRPQFPLRSLVNQGSDFVISG